MNRHARIAGFFAGSWLLALAAGAHPQSSKALFQPAPGSPYQVGKQPAAVALGDVNGDGKLDVLAANSGSNSVSVLLGDGRGRFREAPGSPFDAGPKPHLVAAGDVNKDGRLDVAVTEHDSNDVRVFLGDGTGRFAPAPGSPFPALRGAKPHNHGLLFSDVNSDGRLDITTSNQDDHSISVLLGDGKGGFRPAAGSPFAVGNSPYPHAIGDVNGDGRLDLVSPNVRANTLSVLLGDGRGGFQNAPGSPHRVETRPYYAAIADVNGDGHADIVATHDDITLASVLLGDGRGNFRRLAPVEVGSRAWKVLLHDVNGDGKPDFITGTLPNHVVVLLGDGAGRFSPAPGSPYAAGRGPWSLAMGDVNGDGKLDIVAISAEENSVTVLLGR